MEHLFACRVKCSLLTLGVGTRVKAKKYGRIFFVTTSLTIGMIYILLNSREWRIEWFIDDIEKGMTKSEVLSLLGRPDSVRTNGVIELEYRTNRASGFAGLCGHDSYYCFTIEFNTGSIVTDVNKSAVMRSALLVRQPEMFERIWHRLKR